MTQQEYDKKKRKCWKYVSKTILTIGGSKEKRVFDYAFDRAFALGKQETKQETKQEKETEMNYDITFCDGENCSRKEQCHRYRELLRFRADKDPNRGDYISMTKPTDTNKCTLFWRDEGETDGKD